MKTFGAAKRISQLPFFALPLSAFPKAMSHLYLVRGAGKDECSFQCLSPTYATQHFNLCQMHKIAGAAGALLPQDEELSSLTAKLNSEQRIESGTQAAQRKMVLVSK